jgi:putative DNA methylase
MLCPIPDLTATRLTEDIGAAEADQRSPNEVDAGPQLIRPTQSEKPPGGPFEHPLFAMGATLLEQQLPFRELSMIADADRRAKDPTYTAHRWWARRPPGVMRGLLLAAGLPASTTLSEYWRAFQAAEPILNGLRVFDPFVGGGTTLVEAARLGATPCGMDVDPLAIKIVEHALDPPQASEVAEIGYALLKTLREQVAHLFRGAYRTWTPLHYFYLAQVTCPHCQRRTPLYKNMVIARDLGKNGGVVREHAIIAFCPDCYRIHHLESSSRKELRCCGRLRLNEGNFTGQKFRCPHCRRSSSHRDLKTGAAPRRLLAVEETNVTHHRRLRAPVAEDRKGIREAGQYLVEHSGELDLPTALLARERIDPRPASYGIERVAGLFTDRQLAVFGRAFQWLRKTEMKSQVRRACMLGLSNALTTNNRLCGYATDYGRIAPLFSIRSYSLPALAVELNPLHPSAGRGTLCKVFERLARSTTCDVRRYVWLSDKNTTAPVQTSYLRGTIEPELHCISAVEAYPGARNFDICIFDPPYFDYIAYSELSEFYRAWLKEPVLGGHPLLPAAQDPVGTFGRALGVCMSNAVKRLRPGRVLAFTYHSANEPAWEAVGVALDMANLLVTGLWPVRNDGHMGHHTHEGNCEWDVVVVCRRKGECVPAVPFSTSEMWCQLVKPLSVSTVDRANMSLAIAMAATRWGTVEMADQGAL